MTRQTSETQGVNVQPTKIDAFGERMAVAIKRAGGATRMAERAGVSGSVLRKWKAGHSDPSRTHLINMARAASISVEWLATGEGEPDQGAGGRPQGITGPVETDLDLLEHVTRAAFDDLQRRGLRLEPAALARLVRVLYRHFATRNEQPDEATVSNIIDLAAYR